MFCVLLEALDLTWLSSEGMKKGQTQTHVQKIWDQVGCACLMEGTGYWDRLESKLGCFVQDMEAVSQSSWEVRLSQTLHTWEEEAAVACFCTYWWTPTLALAQTVNGRTQTRGRLHRCWAWIAWERPCQFALGLRHCSLTWWCLCKQYTFTKVSICPLHLHSRLLLCADG